MDGLTVDDVNWGSLVERTNVFTDVPPSADQLTASQERRAARKRLADVAVNMLMQRVVSDREEGAAALELSVRVSVEAEQRKFQTRKIR